MNQFSSHADRETIARGASFPSMSRGDARWPERQPSAHRDETSSSPGGFGQCGSGSMGGITFPYGAKNSISPGLAIRSVGGPANGGQRSQGFGEDLRLSRSTGLPSRFWDEFETRVERTDGCWNWKGALDSSGYPVLNLTEGGVKVVHRVHRIVSGAPSGLCACHRCDNPKCVNPSHIFVGTHADNVKDKCFKNRQAKGERNGRAKLTNADIPFVFELYEAYGVAKSTIAKMFGVTPKPIRQILTGQRWRVASLPGRHA